MYEVVEHPKRFKMLRRSYEGAWVMVSQRNKSTSLGAKGGHRLELDKLRSDRIVFLDKATTHLRRDQYEFGIKHPSRWTSRTSSRSHLECMLVLALGYP